MRDKHAAPGRSRSAVSALLALVTVFLSFSASAQGSLLITPNRVVLEGGKRTQILNLANVGSDSATYNITFVQIRMRPDGSFEQISEPDSGQLFASKYLRFFPRSVTLGPNEAQTVKVQANRLNELAQGEYRSHIYFRAVPREKPLGSRDPKKDSSISIKLVPVFGISIPAIIRIGENTAKARLSDVAFHMDSTGVALLDIDFHREGNMSVYGDIIIDHISATGKVTQVGLVKGLSVYTPNTVRHFRMVLEKKAGVSFTAGKLRVTYNDQSLKPVMLAQTELPLQ
jgi:hypothetical protein